MPNHLYHGKNPTQAFPIGNLAHEMAIAQGSRAYGVFVIALGDDYRTYEDYPAWLRPLLPAVEPRVPTLVDLRALRPYQRLFKTTAPEELWQLRALLHGYDAIVLLPGRAPANASSAGVPMEAPPGCGRPGHRQTRATAQFLGPHWRRPDD